MEVVAVRVTPLLILLLNSIFKGSFITTVGFVVGVEPLVGIVVVVIGYDNERAKGVFPL